MTVRVHLHVLWRALQGPERPFWQLWRLQTETHGYFLIYLEKDELCSYLGVAVTLSQGTDYTDSRSFAKLKTAPMLTNSLLRITKRCLYTLPINGLLQFLQFGVFNISLNLSGLPFGDLMQLCASPSCNYDSGGSMQCMKGVAFHVAVIFGRSTIFLISRAAP